MQLPENSSKVEFLYNLSEIKTVRCNLPYIFNIFHVPHI